VKKQQAGASSVGGKCKKFGAKEKQIVVMVGGKG